ncbi:MAG: teichuronic acid biosynthesis glycosyltransferase TuaG [Psychromonas sp.]|jgi:teichuronic acid biosynthesis glycosyltransferase TuaG|uniref:glycosyltransferase family 2 protein n=1 Tax=Psychromonas sp. TaxID=1884585 RepID=UPI0039E6EE9C
MLVSIITPSYNSEKFLVETYQSIISQTYQDWEWLITDDCSTDNSWTLIGELAKNDNRIKPQQNSVNAGAPTTRNNAIARAKGEYIAFLDSDDIWLPKKLAQHLEFMIEKNSVISFTPYYLMSEQSAHLNLVIDARLTGSFNYQAMLRKKATMGCCTVMVKKIAFTDLTMPLVQAGQDYALWLKLLKTGVSADIYTVPLSNYRLVKGSLSNNKINKAKKTWFIYREIEQLNLLKASIVFCHYAVSALFKWNQSKL